MVDRPPGQQPSPEPRSRSARALGWFSAILGLPALVWPAGVNRLIGVPESEARNRVVRAVGAQELSVAAGLLSRPRPVGWQWSRLGGDLAHLLLLTSAMGIRGADRRRLGRTVLAVLAVTFVDLVTAARLLRNGQAAGGSVEVRRVVTVRRPPEEVYRHWRDLQNLPTFMAHLRSVETLDATRSHWVAAAPAGATVAWDAEIVEDVPGELIAWQSVDGATVGNRGTVRFAAAPGDQGTEVRVELQYDPPAGRAGMLAAKLLGEEPDQQLADDLRRFKQVMEAGHVVRSDGTPQGTHARRLLKQRPARPGEKGVPS